MRFTRINPPAALSSVVECYWTVESDDPIPLLQKIIPDGFPELIFHFGDPYNIQLADTWEVQAPDLLAGQITKFFFLENQGKSDILGVKLKPTAVPRLFQVEMAQLRDRVAALGDLKNKYLLDLAAQVRHAESHTARIDILNTQLSHIVTAENAYPELELAVEKVFATRGIISTTELCLQSNLNERQAERLFKKYVGLSPKFYSRVIRFSNIFQLAQQKKLSWSEVGLEAGFYDQAHFIKDFKAFTGEDPSRYFFDEPNLANFFMKKN